MEDDKFGDVEAQKANQRVNVKVYLASMLTFFSIFAAAILHANDAEFFTALLTDSDLVLAESTIVQISSLYDSIYYLAYFAGLILGPFSDNRGKRKVFIVTGSVAYILISAMLLVSRDLRMLLTFRLLQGIAHILVWQSLMVLVYDFSKSRNIARGVSIYTIFLGSGMGLGTMLGGIFADIHVFGPMFVSIGCYVFVLIISSLKIRDPQHAHRRPTLRENFALIKSKPQLSVPLIFNFVDRLHMGFLITIIPLYLTYSIPLQPSLRGMITGIVALPPLFLSYPVGKKSDAEWGRFRPLITGSIFYGVFLSLTVVIAQKSIILFILMLMLQGCAQGFTTTPNNSLLGDLIDAQNKATAVAFFNFFGNLGIILGPLLALLFAQNYLYAFLVAGMIELITLGINYLMAKKMHFVSL